MKDQDLQNVAAVYLKQAELHYETTKDRYPQLTVDAVRAIYGSCVDAVNGGWIPFDQLLLKVTPALKSRPLHQRLIGVLRLVGFANENIAPILNRAIQAVFEEHRRGIGLRGTPTDLDGMRKHLLALLSEHEYGEWLGKMIQSKDNRKHTAQALDAFENLARQPLAMRFVRKSNPQDRWGWLRDQWEKAKKAIQKKVDLCELAPSMTEGQGNET